MKYVFASLLLFPFAFAGCNAILDPDNQGSGVKKSEAREVGAFTKLKIATAANVEVVRGEKPAIEVTTDDNILPLIATQITDGELVISTTGSFSTSLGVRVKVTASALARIETSSASQLSVEDATADDLKLVLKGASKIDWTGGAKRVTVSVSEASRATLKSPINDLSAELSGASELRGSDATKTADDLKLVLKGASKIDWAGGAKRVSVNASGASRATLKSPVNDLSAELGQGSELRGFDATTATAKIKASGASRAEVNVVGELDAEASEGSTVVYAGGPRAKVKATGASTVRAK
jgi:hypothetical protein